MNLSVLFHLVLPPPSRPLCTGTITALRTKGGLTAGLTVVSGYLSKHCHNKIWRKLSYMTTGPSSCISLYAVYLKTLIVKQ